MQALCELKTKAQQSQQRDVQAFAAGKTKRNRSAALLLHVHACLQQHRAPRAELFMIPPPTEEKGSNPFPTACGIIAARRPEALRNGWGHDPETAQRCSNSFFEIEHGFKLRELIPEAFAMSWSPLFPLRIIANELHS